MNIVFYLSAVIAILSTFLVITRLNAMHALLYLIVSQISIALMFFTLGAPFVGALEIIIYAGAIMVLFLFAIMLLNLGPTAVAEESQLLSPRIWMGPVILIAILLIELVYSLAGNSPTTAASAVNPRQVGIALFSQYVLGTEMASFLLMAGLVGAYHLGRREVSERTMRQMFEAAEAQQPEQPPVEIWPEQEPILEEHPPGVFQPQYTGEGEEPREEEGGESE